ncbi:MAG: hypothetical protein MI810_15015 [Flavobacteriales bacterium]|nr:hypothetical protein [Flavobacteriales bacterium]
MKRPHQISKLIFEVDVPGMETAFSFQNEASSFIRNEVQLVLEELLDEFDHEGKVIRIDRLELDLQGFNFDPANLPGIKERLRTQLREKLNEQLSEANARGDGQNDLGRNVQIREESDDVIKLIVHFLKHGRIPWWAAHFKEVRINDEIKTLLQEEAELLLSEIQSNLQHQNFRKRLVYQLNKDNLFTILLSLSQFSEENESFVKQLIKRTTSKDNWEPYFKLLAIEIPEVTEFKKIGKFIEANYNSVQTIREILTAYEGENDNLNKLIHAVVEMDHFMVEEKLEILENYIGKHKKLQNKEEIIEWIRKSPIVVEDADDEKKAFLDRLNQPDEEIEDHVQVKNAGMVILQPYFLPFFDGIGLLENKQFKTEELQHQAVYLLHYLATGEIGEEIEEHSLLLNKILCGIDPDEVINPPLPFTDEQKEEADNLLKAILDHWKALKSTSTQGLRELFLKREGHLSRKDGTWVLYIERETPDVLIDKLPWGISILRAPWSPEMLYVEW